MNEEYEMNPLLNGMNDRQAEAVQTTEGPLLIMAGAGSGKTRVLTHRIAYLIDEKMVNPWNILAITFTNKAAREMKDRAYQLNPATQYCLIATFHSMCVRILRREADHIGYNRNFTIVDPGEQRTLMKRILKNLNLDPKKWNERAILGTISNAKNDLIDEVAYANLAGDMYTEIVAKCYTAYQKELRQSEAMDFDDLIMLTLRLFDQNPDVLTYYQQRYQYIHVDEYQDTNHAQYQLVKLLASRFKNICVVGDADQSIYGWRGADMQNILDFEKDYPEAKVVLLEENYRSTKTILQAANEVIRNNRNRRPKNLWTQNEDGEEIVYYRANDEQDEALFVARTIDQLSREGYSHKDFAVLYRTNAQSRLFEEKFLLANVPYKIVGGVNFYARKEIKDLLSYLKTIDNASDDLAVRRILNVPKRGIGLTSIGRVQDYADMMNLSFYDALRVVEEVPSIGRAAGKINDFVSFIQGLKSKAEAYTVRETLEEVIELTGYVKELEAEKTEEAQARIENIDELISKTESFQEAMEEAGQPATLSAFLEEIALVADIDSVDPDQDYVLLMTLHSAKGLEFPNVFIVGMEDGVFPGYASIWSGDPSDIEEERRLCYVGITRAMKELTLTCAKQRMIRGETQYNRVSRFVREVPRELVDLGHTIQEKKPRVDDIVSPKSAYAQMKMNFQAKTSLQKKDFTVTKAAKLDYGVGDTVRHVKFGVGIVKNIAEGGRDYEVTVDFDKVGVKKMFAGFAKLKKI